MPDISVCVPVYNGEVYLKVCLESVVAQAGVNLELIIGDDNSTDRSLEIVAEIQSKFPEIKWKIIRHASRLGMAGNWNACVEAATGNFIKVMGQDDLLYPGCLIKQLSLLENHPDVGLCASSADILSARGRKIMKRKRKFREGILDGDEFISKCIARAFNFIGEPVTAMFRKSDIAGVGHFDASMSYFIDLDMWMRLLKGKNFAFIDESLCGFRIHRGGASFSLQNKGYKEFLRLEQKVNLEPPLSSFRQSTRKFLAARDSVVRLAAYNILGVL